MSKDDKKRIIDNIKATLAVENQKLSHFDIKLLEDFADDKITLEEAMNLLKTMVLGKV